VTVTGVDDDFVDGDIAFSVVVAAATSDDSNYAGLNGMDVSATTKDGKILGLSRWHLCYWYLCLKTLT
jgi:hypothetical protein